MRVLPIKTFSCCNSYPYLNLKQTYLFLTFISNGTGQIVFSIITVGMVANSLLLVDRVVLMNVGDGVGF